MRYIDADKLIDKIFPIGLIDDGNYTINAKAVKIAIDKMPTADVVPKSEVKETVEKLMSATDKVICEAKQEVAREIFEEIEKHLVYYPRCCEYSIDERDYEKIKKKYTKESEGER